MRQVRAQFPALSRCHRGRSVAYFDGPGGTQVPTPVVDAMVDYLYHHNANTHWAYPSSHETDQLIAHARAAYAELLNASPDEIAFGLNMTTLTFHLARALGRAWGPGDEVVVTELDHHANVAPWRALVHDRGITVRTARFDPATGELDLDHLTQCLSSRTRLVAVGAASNVLGTINDVAGIVRLAHSVGALAFVDAVHYTAHGPIDVGAWQCDFLACSAYKLYGPHVGVLFGRRALLERIDIPKLDPAPNDPPPERVETGTQNHEGIVGAAAAVDFVASMAPSELAKRSRRERLLGAFDLLHRDGEALVSRLWDGLAGIPNVKRYGPRPGRPRTPTVVFTVRDRSAHEVARHLANSALFLSSGDFYAPTILERLGVLDRGLVRAGSACYTTADEIDRLLDAVAGLGE